MKPNYWLLTFLILILLPGNMLYSQENTPLQKSWTLEECIRYALENNIDLKSERLSVEESKISLSDSKWAFAPNVSASTSYNLSIIRLCKYIAFRWFKKLTTTAIL